MRLVHHLLLHAVAVAHCSELRSGLSHLFTTPILRHQLIDADDDQNSDLLATMESLVLRSFREFQQSCGPLEEDETENDRFFTMQREAFERGDPSFLEEGTSTSEFEAFATLRNAWLENAREYLATAASEAAAAQVFDGEVDVFCWASVHEGNSIHVPHTHPHTAVSGCFYVSIPPGVGAISFDDPRAAHSPVFAVNRRTHEPVAGELLLFPPWVIHLVSDSSAASSPRISISFNVYCPRAEEEEEEAEEEAEVDDEFEGNEDWRVLADTEIVAGA